MVKKLKQLAGEADSSASSDASGATLARTVRDSAQQIWLAGLGAFSKTQDEGSKVFEALVKEGKGLESKTRRVAERKFADVTEQFGRKTETATAKATATWDKLEQVFEDRVARALSRLGVPTRKEIQLLTTTVEALTASVGRLTATGPAVSSKPATKAQKSTKRAKSTKSTQAVVKTPTRRRA